MPSNEKDNDSQDRGGPSRAPSIENRRHVVLIAIPRAHVLAVTFLSLLLAFYLTANIELRPEIGDSTHNFGAGITLGETGVYGPTPNSVGWSRREPLVPFLIGGYHVLRSWLGLPVAPLSCVPAAAQQTPECRQVTAPYRLINVGFLVLAAVCCFILVYWLVGNAVPAYAAYFLTGTSAVLYDSLGRFLTEAPAGALMALVSVFLYRLFARREVWSAFALGASLAALVLTKVIFAYFLVVVVVSLLVPALIERKTSKRLFALTGIMIAVYAVIVGSWMARNYYLSGSFRISDGRSFGILAGRAELNKMRIDEFWAGFLYAVPMLTEKDLMGLGLSPESFARYNDKSPYGFYESIQKTVLDRWKAEQEAAIERGVPRNLARRYASELMERQARAEILSHPLAHLRTTILLAAMRNFPEIGFGSRSRHEQIGDQWGINVSKVAYQLSPNQRTWFNAATTLAILVLPFVMWWQGRNLAGLIVVLPVYYSHALYAAVSHFNARYAFPEIPLRNVALCAVLFVIAAALFRQVQRRWVTVSPA